MPLAEAFNVLCSLVSSVYRNQQLFPFTTIFEHPFPINSSLAPVQVFHCFLLLVGFSKRLAIQVIYIFSNALSRLSYLSADCFLPCIPVSPFFY